MRITTLALTAALALLPLAAQAADLGCIDSLRPVVEKHASPFVSAAAKDRELATLAMMMGCYSPADLTAAGWPDPAKFALAVSTEFVPLPPIPTFTVSDTGKIAARQ